MISSPYRKTLRISQLEIYLVGGAVRDELLGLTVTEKDWVVVGATPEELLALGFTPVGKEFPVFLHPLTHEEYALARTERKVGKGYKGFTFYTSKEVTLAEDLKRRDLTINAMAKTVSGELIDPYHGQRDLKEKILRHVSSAFEEDPVRILRLARFSAKFPDFTIHQSTQQLMEKMVALGEVDALVAERVWQELAKSLLNEKPRRFFETLRDCGAALILFPDLALDDSLLTTLDRASAVTTSPIIRLATVFYQIPPAIFKQWIERFRIPNEFSDFVSLLRDYHNVYVNCLQNDASAFLKFIKQTDALRRPQRFQDFLLACNVIHHSLNPSYAETVERLVQAVKSVDTLALQEKNLSGKAFADALENLRLQAIIHANLLAN